MSVGTATNDTTCEDGPTIDMPMRIEEKTTPPNFGRACVRSVLVGRDIALDADAEIFAKSDTKCASNAKRGTFELHWVAQRMLVKVSKLKITTLYITNIEHHTTLIAIVGHRVFATRLIVCSI